MGIVNVLAPVRFACNLVTVAECSGNHVKISCKQSGISRLQGLYQKSSLHCQLTRPIDFRHGDFQGRTSLARVKVTGKQFVCLTGR